MRYIELGHTGNYPTATLCCIPNTLQEPTLITSFGSDTELCYFGSGDISAVADLDAVQAAGVTFHRFNYPGLDMLGALVSHSTVFFSVTCAMDAQVLRRACHAASVRVLRVSGIETRSQGNDLYVEMDGLWKKFFGDFKAQGQRFSTAAAFTSFDFDLGAARTIYNLNTEKFRRKGKVSNISDVVCGLHDAQPGLNPLTYRDDLVHAIAERLGEKLVPGNFTANEQTVLDDFHRKMRDPEWIEHGKWPG